MSTLNGCAIFYEFKEIPCFFSIRFQVRVHDAFFVHEFPYHVGVGSRRGEVDSSSMIGLLIISIYEIRGCEEITT